MRKEIQEIIVKDVKQKGKKAFNRVLEFFWGKKKRESIRVSVRG